MAPLILGLVLFLGIHLVPTIPPLRARWVAALGAGRYKAAFSLTSALGLALIVIGYMTAPRGDQLFQPSDAARAVAPLAMIASFILLASANMSTHIRAALRHPMLIGVGIWAGVHLLANGDARGTLLFGSFLAYVLIDLASAISRHAVKPFVPAAKYDAMAVAGGVALAIVVMLFHRMLFGMPAVSWSL